MHGRLCVTFRISVSNCHHFSRGGVAGYNNIVGAVTVLGGEGAIVPPRLSSAVH